MRRIGLGRTGTTVSALGLGCAGMAQALGTEQEPDAMATMHAALEAGMDFFDTADLYGVGKSERLIGRFVAEAGRQRLTIATKFGSMPGAADGVGSLPRSVNNDPAYIPLACEASLRRLGTEVIDLYYMHRRDPAVPIADSVGAMARLVEAGKIRCIGLSEVSAGTLRAAHAVHPVTALQSEYSLWMRDREADVLPVCVELGITFVPFSPLGRAFLTGTLAPDRLAPTDFRASLPRFNGEAATRNMALVAALQAFAAGRAVTAGQVALAWLMAKGREDAAIVPIPGTRRTAYVRENAAAADLVLTEAEMVALDGLFSPDAVTGARYPADEAARVGT